MAHWLLGIGFLVAFVAILAAARTVLRPAALPFLRDPHHPEFDPIAELRREPFGHAVCGTFADADCVPLLVITVLKSLA